MVALVNIGRDECGSLGIGSSHNEIRNTHYVILKANGDQTVDVLRNGDQDLRDHIVSTTNFTGSIEVS